MPKNASIISNEESYLIKEIITSEIDVDFMEIRVMERKAIRLIAKTPISGSFVFWLFFLVLAMTNRILIGKSPKVKNCIDCEGCSR